MKARNILVLVVILLAGLAWWLGRTKGPNTLDRPLSDFMVPDTSKVDRIFIAVPDGRTVDLYRTPSGWRVKRGEEDYPARQHNVELLLRTFFRVEVRSPVPKSAEANVLRVMAANARKVEIYEGGKKPSKVWIVGHSTKDHFGTYMLLEKPGEGRSSVPFIMSMSGFTGILQPRFHAELDEWRQSVVFDYPDLYQVAAVEVENPHVAGSAYRIEHLEDGRVRLVDGRGGPLPFDTVLVKGALLPMRRMNYEYIDRNVGQEERDSLLATLPNHVLRVEERDGTVRRASFWYKPYEGDLSAIDAPQQIHDKVRMHALVEDSLLVVVQRQMWDVLVQPARLLATGDGL
jgi:hypothetical protein